MANINRRDILASSLVLGAAAWAPAGIARASSLRVDPAFPQGFLWGASTAAHQVEGNNTNADLWVIENVPGTVFAERSGDAANSFELWSVDLDLVKGMDLGAYRFSLEWARIEPDKGHFSSAMLDHYKAMIKGCRARGLEPVVTFNHFTTPRWFAAQGGWHNPESPTLFARFCEHERGLKVYGEALEDKRPLLGDDLAMRTFADIPMAALWTWQKGNTVRSTLLGDIKGAASVAHVYGKPIVAAESMTAVNTPWGFAPRDLRRFIDTAFVNGVNRPVIHTSVHQPLDNRQPGLSLLIFGQYFNRHETWADMAGAWVDYMARTGYMLQQGTYQADVVVFTGEDMPVTAHFATSVPADLPRRNGYDFVNAAMLSDALRVEQGQIVSQGGTAYRALYLGRHARWMTLPTLRRIADMARAGATIIGERPKATPSLADDADAFARLADQVWAWPNVIGTDDFGAGLEQAAIAPDFEYAGGSAGSDIPFLHRRLSDGGEIFFLVNRRDQGETISARFRVTGYAPEFWDAVSGTSRPLSYSQDGTYTVIPLSLEAEGSGFVVFRQKTDDRSRTVQDMGYRRVGKVAGPWQVSFEQGRGVPIPSRCRS